MKDSVTEISNGVRVTFRGVNKIINHYAHHGTLMSDVVTDDILQHGSFRCLAFNPEKY